MSIALAGYTHQAFTISLLFNDHLVHPPGKRFAHGSVLHKVGHGCEVPHITTNRILDGVGVGRELRAFEHDSSNIGGAL